MIQVPNIDRKLLFLILVNLIPLIGIVFWSWSVFSIVYFYWQETVVMALWMIVKIIKTDNKNFDKDPVASAKSEKIGLVLFLSIYFSLALLLYRLFIFVVFGPSDVESTTKWFSLIALLIAHGFLYYENFIKTGGDLKPTKKSGTPQTIKRIFILHVVIVLGGMLGSALGAPILAIILMVILKITAEITLQFSDKKSALT